MYKIEFSHNAINHYEMNGQLYHADSECYGVLVNPVLPIAFHRLTMVQRPVEHLKKWLDFPYIEKMESGVYRVSCLTNTDNYGPRVYQHFYDFMQAIQFAITFKQALVDKYFEIGDVSCVL